MAPFPLPIENESSVQPVPTSTAWTPTLVDRQNDAPAATVTVIAERGGGGTTLDGGEIAGIVLGTIAGTLLLLWLIRSCFNLGAPAQERESWYNGVEPKRRHRHHSRHHSHSRHRSSDGSVQVPPPVVVKDYTRSHRQQPTYVYADANGARGRRHSRDY